MDDSHPCLLTSCWSVAYLVLVELDGSRLGLALHLGLLTAFGLVFARSRVLEGRCGEGVWEGSASDKEGLGKGGCLRGWQQGMLGRGC